MGPTNLDKNEKRKLHKKINKQGISTKLSHDANLTEDVNECIKS